MSYDYMDWNFVSYLFDKMGFGPQWKKWMSACVEGSPTQPIEAQRGLRQCDSLSPFICTLVGEGLNKLVEKVKSLGIVRGFSVVGIGPVIAHLQFADNTCSPVNQVGKRFWVIRQS